MDCHRFARSGGSRYEEVGHFPQIGEMRFAGYACTQGYEKRFVGTLKLIGKKESAETDHGFRGVWYFNADQRFPRYRSFYAQRMGGQSQSQIILQSDNTRKFHALCRFESIASDGRTDGYFVHFNIYAEIGESSLYD